MREPPIGPLSQPTFVLPNHPCDQTYSMNHTKWARGHVLNAYFVRSSVLNGSTDVLETVEDVRGVPEPVDRSLAGPVQKTFLTDCFTKWDNVIIWPPVPQVGEELLSLWRLPTIAGDAVKRILLCGFKRVKWWDGVSIWSDLETRKGTMKLS